MLHFLDIFFHYMLYLFVFQSLIFVDILIPGV